MEKGHRKAVSEGKDYNTYLHTLLLSPKTEPKKIAIQLVHFGKIETDHLCLAGKKKSKKEIVNEITRWIVYSIKKAQPIAVAAYLPPSSKSPFLLHLSLPSSFIQVWQWLGVQHMRSPPGTAIKMCTNKWHVVLENGTVMTVSDDNLIDSNNFNVQQNG